MQILTMITEIMYIQLLISKRIDGYKVNNAINSKLQFQGKMHTLKCETGLKIGLALFTSA